MQAGNRNYLKPGDLPSLIPVFPLAGALLLPLGQMPLNIFEPRYLAMIDHALANDRIIGMIQPKGPEGEAPELREIGCAGRITSFAETGDGRYLITLSGISRFKVMVEAPSQHPFRLCRVTYEPFASDLAEAPDADAVDRAGLLRTLRAFLDANSLKADWDSIQRTPTEILVNALAMMGPYDPPSKQALLEAPDLVHRAETLVALAEASMARGPDGKAQLN